MADTKYTQGEYVTRHNHGALDMDIFQSALVKLYAKNLAEERKIKPGKKKAARGGYTITFSEEIWGLAYKKYENEA